MKEFWKKYKKYIIVSVFSLLLILVLTLKQKNRRQTITFPSPSVIPVKFELKGTVPTYGVGAQIFDTNAIEFKFSKPIDVSTMSISIVPDVYFDYETDNNDRSLFIRPIEKWETNKLYVFTIDIKSKERDVLDNKIEYKLQIIKIESGIVEIFPTPTPAP